MIYKYKYWILGVVLAGLGTLWYFKKYLPKKNETTTTKDGGEVNTSLLAKSKAAVNSLINQN